MRGKGLIGIIAALLLVMAVIPTGAVAATANVTTNAGPISIPDLKISMIKLSDDEIKVGDTLKIEVIWDKFPADQGTRRIAVIDWVTYNDTVKSGNQINVAELLDEAEQVWTLPEDAGSWTGDEARMFTPTEAGYYVVVVFVNDTTFNDSLVFKAVPTVAGKPSVSISVDKSVIAIGDCIKVKATMSSDYEVNVTVFVTGMGVQNTKFLYGPDTKAMRLDDSWYVCIPADWMEGVYVAKIVAGNKSYKEPSDPTRSEAVATFKVEKPDILSIDVPAQHVKGTDLVITGTTNLQKSGTKNDNETKYPNVENIATLEITDLNDNTKATATAYIDEGGSFKFKIDNFGKDLDTGYYKVKITIDSGALTDTETTTFELVKATLKLTADKYSVTRGSSVTFTIDTNLKINSAVNFTIEDQRIVDHTKSGSKTETYYVDALGDVKIKITVDTEAPLTDYKFKAEIPNLGVSDEVIITVVKQALNITAEKNVAVRGGSVRFTGTTTADIVYIYASERDVFEVSGTPVAELPSETELTGSYLDTAKVYPDTNDKLDFKISVNKNADPGAYYLYFYAPANTSKVDRASDAQAVIAITVTDPRIVSVDIPSRIPYQGAVEVSILTDPGDRENVRLDFVLEGMNIKARPSDFGLAGMWMPDAKNYVNFTLDLKNYKNGDKQIEPGLYVFTVKLYLCTDSSCSSTEEVDSARTEKLVEIVPQTLDVEISPSTIVVGDKITVTITTNREGKAGYDHIWITMVGPNYKAVQRVTLDSSGKGVATFETIGLSAGTYKFYIRDTAGTINEDQITENKLVEDLYNLDPADPIARVYGAQDDILVVKTIELLEKAVTTTTTATTTTTVVTTTTTTTTVATTTTTTTTATTTTTTPGGGIPGFEAVFAIAGLLAVAYLLRRR